MGGAEVFTYEVAKRWAKAGHDLTLFTSEYAGSEKEEILDGVRVVRAGGKYSVYRKAKKYYEKRFSKEAFDVVVDEINTRPFLTPKFVDNNEKIVALIHQLAREYWFYETPFPVSYVGYHILEERWLRNYVDIPTVTVSESTMEDLLDLGFEKVFVVREGLNFKPLSEVPDKEDHPVIAFVGRLKRAKRPDHAVRAFRIAKERIPDAKLWIIGDGYFKQDLEKIAPNEVEFFGGLSDGKRRELVKRAWIVVNPSSREGFGLNVVEANALGTPCIAYDVAGLRDSIKNDKTGLLATAGSIGDLADKITQVLKDHALRERLSKNALEYSGKFDWDTSTREFERVVGAFV